MTNTMNRRAMLGRLAAAGAATAALPVTTAAAAPASSLAALIEAHKAAWRAREDYRGIEDRLDPRYYLVDAEEERIALAEWGALTSLCAYRPQNMEEVRQRGDYLVEFRDGDDLNEDQLTALFASFRSTPAGRIA